MLRWTHVILALIWLACAIAGYLYAVQQNIPIGLAMRVLPTFLLEATFFYVLGSDRLRARIEKWPPTLTAIGLTAAAIAPYVEASWALGSFRNSSFLAILGLAAVVSFWYVVLPRDNPFVDMLLLVLMAAVM